ncbi:MAG: ABC transporter substrate-binding protein [bacterium]
MRRILPYGLVGLVVLLLLGGAGPSDPLSGPGWVRGGPLPQPRGERVLHIGLVGRGRFHPLPPALMEEGPERWVMEQVYGPGLHARGRNGLPDSRTVLTAEIIDGVRPGWTFYTLYPEIRYQDGTLLRLEDIRSTYHLYRDMARAGDAGLDPAFAFLDSVSLGRDLNRVGLVMPARFGDQAHRLAASTPLHPAMLRGLPEGPQEVRATLESRDIVALGSYRLSFDVRGEREGRSVQGSEVIMRLEADDTGPMPDPEVRRVVIHLFPNDQELVRAFVTGRIQVARLPSYAAQSRLREEMSGQEDRGFISRFFHQRDHFIFLAFNNAFQPLRSAPMRRALAYAVNREAMKHPELREVDVVSDVPLLPGTPFGRTVQYTYRPRHAAVLLREAGYTMRGGELVDEAGSTVLFNLIYPGTGRHFEQIARRIKVDLQSVGVMVNAEPLCPEEIDERLREGNYQMALSEMSLPPTSEALLRLFHSDNAATGVNFTRYRSRTFDSNIEAAVVRSDIEEPDPYYRGAVERIQEDIPLIPIYFERRSYYAFDTTVLDAGSVGRISRQLEPLARWRWSR